MVGRRNAACLTLTNKLEATTTGCKPRTPGETVTLDQALWCFSTTLDCLMSPTHTQDPNIEGCLHLFLCAVAGALRWLLWLLTALALLLLTFTPAIMGVACASPS